MAIQNCYRLVFVLAAITVSKEFRGEKEFEEFDKKNVYCLTLIGILHTELTFSHVKYYTISNRLLMKNK